MKRKDPNKYPPGLNARRVQAIIDHYDNQSEEEALAEDEAFRGGPENCVVKNSPKRKLKKFQSKRRMSFAKLESLKA